MGRYEQAQFITRKFLIFAVLSYMLIMSVKNYNNFKHNAVVNRHRQNALVTFQALVVASGEKGTGDIILANASACIFSPQETGFSQGGKSDSAGAKSVLELMTRSATKSAE